MSIFRSGTFQRRLLLDQVPMNTPKSWRVTSTSVERSKGFQILKKSLSKNDMTEFYDLYHGATLKIKEQKTSKEEIEPKFECNNLQKILWIEMKQKISVGDSPGAKESYKKLVSEIGLLSTEKMVYLMSRSKQVEPLCSFFFQELCRYNDDPPPECYAVLIESCALSGNTGSYETLRKMLEEKNVEIDQKIYQSMLIALASFKNYEELFSLPKKMEEQNLKMETSTLNYVLFFLCNKGRHFTANDFFVRMRLREVEADSKSYCILMNADNKEGFEKLEKLYLNGINYLSAKNKLDEDFFASAIWAATNNRKLEWAEQVYKECIEVYKIVPTWRLITSRLRCLSISSKLNLFESFAQESLNNNPNIQSLVTSYRIGAYSRQYNTVKVEEIWKEYCGDKPFSQLSPSVCDSYIIYLCKCFFPRDALHKLELWINNHQFTPTDNMFRAIIFWADIRGERDTMDAAISLLRKYKHVMTPKLNKQLKRLMSSGVHCTVKKVRYPADRFTLLKQIEMNSIIYNKNEGRIKKY